MLNEAEIDAKIKTMKNVASFGGQGTKGAVRNQLKKLLKEPNLTSEQREEINFLIECRAVRELEEPCPTPSDHQIFESFGEHD
jgi:hypothetical protein